MKFETTYESRNYPIIIEHNASNQLTSYTSQYQHVITLVDETVYTLWRDKVNELVQKTEGELIILPAGEKVKTFEHYHTMLEQLLHFQPTRQTCLVSIGGGATGDFVGFLAATLLRGVDFVQMPTTLLAHDSSIGGKVGINAASGKNLIGAFHRPIAVIYDLDFLKTLPQSEILSGYAELYKHALLSGNEATLEIEKHFSDSDALKQLDHIETFILKGIQTKLEIVLQDELEKGQRQFLNLGHTFGHAIEYEYKIPHGHAVIIGILYQFIVTNLMHDLNFDLKHYYQYFDKIGYPMEQIKSFSLNPILTLMMQDKKNNAEGVRMVLLTDIGAPVVKTIDKDTLKRAFEILQNL
ncbi:3-dehydroquinate synthase [Staphylococcus canis]|uniref:3-dehydroquinate synthase n=1 Tax=Staphylococcus canis TaxID=2724942 RepID=A0ABS0T9D0_9STAP|nr:3-dehydroquinate synthase [Staphylococcus canis]MBI5975359.1 3-dehydroquinate synthase [Staphylococcus canis]